MDFVSTIKGDLAEYAGLSESHKTEIESTLQSIVQAHGKDALLDENKLWSLLNSRDVDSCEALKVMLLTRVNGFSRIVQEDTFVRRADLDCYVQNAFDQTGLNRKEIARITRALVLAVGTVNELEQVHGWGTDDRSDATVAEHAFTIPTALYDQELREFGKRLGQALQSEETFDDIEYDILEPLVAMGIPRAQYYMGYYLIRSKIPETQRRGYELLQAAARAGDSEACAELGDYCYSLGTSKWPAAFSYYTGFGATALNDSRRRALAVILNRKRFNMTMLVMSACMLCCMLITEVLQVGSPAYSGHPVLGILCTLLSAGVLAMGFLHHRVEPYDDAYVFPAIVFGFWTLYMAVRFVS